LVHAKIINDNNEIHYILVSKAKENTYYLMYDDIFFEKIKKKENISREFYTISRRITNSKNRIKHISFTLKDDYTIKEIYELVELLRRKTIILLTLFNEKINECDLLFISNENDLEVEHYINDFLEIEEI
jgi:hypothetical protein